MTADPLPAPAQADHLTTVLRRAGVLGNACVREVVVESSRSTILSRIMRLRLCYDRADVDAPHSLILKTGLPERIAHGVDGGRQEGWEGGRQEVAFYTQVASAMPTLPVPRCYEAHWDEATKAWHLLLEDLTDSHFVVAPWPLPPTIDQCERMVEARARFQAAWWDDPRLGVSIGTWADATAIDQYLRRLAEEVGRFADRLGDCLSLERRTLYDLLPASSPATTCTTT